MTAAPNRTKFGRWILNVGSVSLEIEAFAGAAETTYQVRLEQLTDSAHILDWIFQVQEKTWASTSDVGDFVEAVVYIFGRGCCGGGQDTSFDVKARLRLLGCDV